MRRALIATALLLPFAAACGSESVPSEQAEKTAAQPVTVTLADAAALWDTETVAGLVKRCANASAGDVIELGGVTQLLSKYCDYRRRANIADAESNVRNGIVALEAYYTEHGTYEGATADGLRAAYDAGLLVTLGNVTASGYCVQSVVGDASYRKAGPDAEIEEGRCDGAPVADAEVPLGTGDDPPADTTQAAEARANVRGAIPAIETYYAENQTYTGATLKALQAYDRGVRNVQVVTASARSYCVQSTVGQVTVSKPGPSTKLVQSPCA